MFRARKRQAAATATAIVKAALNKQRKKRKCWVRSWIGRSIAVPTQKNLGGNEVLPKFCDVCPNHDLIVQGWAKFLIKEPYVKIQNFRRATNSV